jgi:ferric-dicitrate binding protein FerR (iron transport regulator)
MRGWDVDRAWQRTRPKLEADVGTPVTPLRPHRAPRSVAWRIAAALVVAVGVGSAWLALRKSDVVYTTAAGERREVQLSDGSTVMLAPRSTLTVPADFASDERRVTLNGEGWFSVAHRANSEFAVETPTHLIRDIGTVFTVWARAGDSVRVAVSEGEVAVRELDGTIGTEHRVAAGEAAGFAAANAAPLWRVAKLQTDTIGSWRDGTLDVESESAENVRGRLARWYGVSIEFADTALNSRNVTASLPLDSLEQGLHVLALLLDATVERTERGFILRTQR